MPIIAGVVVEPPPVGPPPVAMPEIGYASITYYDPDGTAWPMTGVDEVRGYWALADDVSGLGAAPIQLATDPHPRGGARLRHMQPQPRTIVWPLHVQGTTHQDFTDRWRALGRAFTSTTRRRIPGVLEIARPDGTRRQISVYYESGYEGLGVFGSGINWDQAAISLFCEDPYWVDAVPVTEHRGYAVGGPFLDPFPTISSGRVLGATTLHNPGDVEAWPEWTITGPASLVTFTNTTTGESFAIDPNAPSIAHGNLLAGEQVTVRTDPQQVRFENGDVWTGALNWPSAQMWPLEPGDNEVTFQLDGSGPGSAVDLSFHARYDTA